MAGRFPFPMPYGWFRVAFSDEIGAGKSKPIRFFNQDMVLFRTESGSVKVLDAYCPHMGAHLGYGIRDNMGEGGAVVGETIVCPFHGWRFNGAGVCEDIPYAKTIPPKIQGKPCMTSWPVAEKNRIVWVWYHPQHMAPLYQVADIPESHPDNMEWTAFRTRRWIMPTAMQEIAENSVDFAHFIYVHGVKSSPEAEYEYDGHRAHRVVKADMATPRGIVEGGIESWNNGPGQGWIRFTGICETLLLSCITPIDEENCEVTFSFLQKKVDGREPKGGVQEAIIADISQQLDEDYVIWKHKVFRERPVLCDGDGPIAQFRKWYAQFYPTSSEPQKIARSA